MAGRKLAAYVYVNGDLFGPDTDVPAEVAEQITNPKAWGESVEDKAAEGYDAQTKADLEAEIAKRNEGRSDDDQIVVEGKGNKPDLVAALEADDSK